MSGLRLVCLGVLSIAVLFGLDALPAVAQSAQDAPTPFVNPNPNSSSTSEFPWASQSTSNDGSRNFTNSLTPAGSRPAGNSSGLNAKALSPTNGIQITGLGSSSAPWTIVVLLTLLALIPSLMICVTPFARLLVVFHFLRQALGLQTTPSNQTLIGLSLVLTFFIMQPVGEQIYREAFVPLENGKIGAFDAVDRGAEPLRHFMAHYVREKDAALFLDIAHVQRPRTVDDIPMRVMMPAYIVSELRAGFQIGAVLFLPFLVVDIVVASITNAVGMMQLPPVVISTPLKLMLFLMVDGWHLLIGALVRSFS
jgi:flagellar biosynthetic protein FliP